MTLEQSTPTHRYGKYLGEHWRQGKGREKAESRCVVEEDAGYTKADKVDKTSKCVHVCATVSRVG
jgi:hypothetical protein